PATVGRSPRGPAPGRPAGRCPIGAGSTPPTPPPRSCLGAPGRTIAPAHHPVPGPPGGPASLHGVSAHDQSAFTAVTAAPPVERFTLSNGLRVVLAPDRSAPVVGVAVVYDVGIRSEPEGRTGFAHLFEHLMFQGSENLEKLAHFRHVQGSGGTFNGSTHFDYTDYFETLPANALERALFLEADRMRGPRLTEENLRNQVDV